MSIIKEYQQYDALGLANLVRTKEVSTAELLTTAIAKCEALNPQINAVINPLYDYAKQNLADLPQGIFSGVPFLLKDLLADVKGIVTSNGSHAFDQLIPTQDATLVRRFKRTGVNIFGKTNTPELGLMGITEPKAFGATRNPWHLDHTPGGSSGGSAAAIAAGIVPMASGGDGGGSIRIPASHCGLFGLKPTRGRNPSGPLHGEHWDGATCEHVITRSVRDSAAMLDATRGAEIGSPFILPEPDESYLTAIKTAPKKLRIGFTTQSPYGGKVAQSCKEAVAHTVTLLIALGHDVEEKTPLYDGELIIDAYLTMYFGHIAADIKQLKQKLGASAALKLEDNTRFLALLGECLSAGDFVIAKHHWFELKKSMDFYHQQYDLFLTPTVADLPVKIGALTMPPVKLLQTKLINTLGAGVARLAKKSLIALVKEEACMNLAKTPFTQLANLTGQPAMSVPLFWSENGLPCGVQFMAPFGDEKTLFKLAAQLEKIQPWAHRYPQWLKEKA
jgi:amidase